MFGPVGRETIMRLTTVDTCMSTRQGKRVVLAGVDDPAAIEEILIGGGVNPKIIARQDEIEGNDPYHLGYVHGRRDEREDSG